MFWSPINTKEVLTDRYEICCIVSSACNKIPNWPQSCGKLLQTKAAVYVFICESLLGIFLHILLHIFIDSKTGKVYNRLVKSLSFGDFLFCVALLFLALSDVYFGLDYPIFDNYWRKSFLCYSVSTLVFISIIISLLSISLITLSRYFIVKKPFDARYKNPYFNISIVGIYIVFSCIFAIGVVLLYKFRTPDGLLPTRLCLLFGGKDLISTLVVSIITVLQLIMALMLPVFNILLIKNVCHQEHKLTEAVSVKHDKAKLMARMLVTCSIHILHWLSCSTLLILTLTLPQYPIQILDWMICVIKPTEILANPFIYGIWKKSHPSKDSSTALKTISLSHKIH